MSVILRATLSLLLIVCAAGACAQEFKPFPKARITAAQWQTYFDEVRAKQGSSERRFVSEKLVVFEDPKDKFFWAFTIDGHPAHPAWIARQPLQEGTVVKMRQIGYFAGSEASFAELFRSYQALNARIGEDVNKSPEQRP